MKLRSINPRLPMPVDLTDSPVEAVLTTDHPESSDSKPVLLVTRCDGKQQAFGTINAELAGFAIVEASEIERGDLREAGYFLPDADV